MRWVAGPDVDGARGRWRKGMAPVRRRGRSLGTAAIVYMASPFLSRPKTAQRLSEPELGKRPL